MSSDATGSFGAAGPPWPPGPPVPASEPSGTARALATAAFAASFLGVLEAVWILLLGFTAAAQCAGDEEITPAAYLVPALVLLALPVVTFLIRRPRRGPPLAVAVAALVVVLGLDFLGAGWSFVAIFFTDGC